MWDNTTDFELGIISRVRLEGLILDVFAVFATEVSLS